jgi:hypothetical protein
MRKLLFIVLITLLSKSLVAQKRWNTRDSVARGVSIVVGTGLSHYINTLQIDPKRIGLRQNFQSYFLKCMWEPEHRLSMGVDIGHYQFYEVQLSEGKSVNTASLAVTPILFCIQMRIFKRFYASAATGVSVHHAFANALGNKSESSTMAFSNLQFTAGYIYPISKRLGIGLQAKFLSENKTEDAMFAVEAEIRYQFKRKYKRVRIHE